MKSTLLLFRKIAMKRIVYFLVVCLITINSQAQNDYINIWAIGNSITEAYNMEVGYGGYRKALEDLLVDLSNKDGSFKFKFVGSTDVHSPGVKHDGHGGWTAWNILNGRDEDLEAEKLSNWIEKIKGEDNGFDYVLLHIGTNDVYSGDRSLDDVIGIDISGIIDELIDKNPDVVIFLAKIIPDRDFNPEFEKFNNMLTELACERTRAGDHIVLVDHYSAFLMVKDDGTIWADESLFHDNLHPSEKGGKVMAQTWYDAIQKVFTTKIRTLTNGAGKEHLGEGTKTDEVTKPNNWRWAEYYFGYSLIDNIVREQDASGEEHVYAFGSYTCSTIEYLMEFGGEEYNRLILRGIADQPAPVKMEIYIDGEYKATAEWDDGDLCNDLAFVKIDGVDRGKHAIAVQFINDFYDPNTNPPEDRNFYLDALMVISNDDEGIPVFVDDDIQAAVNDNPAGTTFIIKATDRDGNSGIHRMQQINPKDGNSFIGEDGVDKPVLSGAMWLNPEGWSQCIDCGNCNDCWVHDGPGDVLHNEIYHEGWCDQDNETKTCQFPEDLFINDRFCQQVNSKDELTAVEGEEEEITRWYFERDNNPKDGKGNHKIYINIDPKAYIAEISVTPFAFGGERKTVQWPDRYDDCKELKDNIITDLITIPDNITIRNLTIEKYACPGQLGAIGFQDPGVGWIIENNEVRLNHGAGIQAGSKAIVKDNYVHDNGHIGIKASRLIVDESYGERCEKQPEYIVENALIEGNRIIQNGKEAIGFRYTEEGGGTKFSHTKNLTVRNNTVLNNRGAGLWADIDNENTLYENNTVKGNWDNGIFHEISGSATIRNNQVRQNGFGRTWNTESDKFMHAQIMVATSEDVEVYNNVVDAGDKMNGIIVRYDYRDEKNEKDEIIKIWNSKNVKVHHNRIIIPEGNEYGLSGVWANINDFKDNTKNLSDLGFIFDYDTYYLDDKNEKHWIWENGKGMNWIRELITDDEGNPILDDEGKVQYNYFGESNLVNFDGFNKENQELNGQCLSLPLAMYFNDGSGNSITELVHPVIIRGENQINSDNWINYTPDIKIGSRSADMHPENNFSVRYDGTLEVDEEADYQFQIPTDGGVRFWLKKDNLTNIITVDDEANWSMGNKTLDTETVHLGKGNIYSFRLEYFHHANAGEPANLRFQWKKDNGSWADVPATVIGPPLNFHGWGMQGFYYNSPNNIGGEPEIVREDQQINFDWDRYDPDSRMDNDGIYGVVWDGKVQPLYNGHYFFFLPKEILYTGTHITLLQFEFDGKIIYPDDFQIGSKWYGRYEIPDDLDNGMQYNLKITFKKYYRDLQISDMVLMWQSSDNKQNLEVVPPYCLYLPNTHEAMTTDPYENGLKATYYNIRSEYIEEQIDEPNWERDLIDFIKNNPTNLEAALEDKVDGDYTNFLKSDWGAGSPDYRIGADYFVVEWNGSITLPEGYSSGVYSFKWSADNIGCLILGDEELTSIDDSEEITQKTMLQNRQHTIRAILLERGGSASAQTVLEWFHIPDFSPEPELSLMRSKDFGNLDDTTEDEYETVPPEAFKAPNIENTQLKLLVFGEDRSSTVSILKSLGYDARATSDVNFLGTSDLSAFDQIWYVDYKKVPDSQGKKNLQDYMMNGGKVLFVGENYQSTNSAYPLWRDNLFNELGAGGIKQSQTINPTKIGYYYTNPDHILSQSPFTVASVKHLSTGNGTFESTGNGTVIAGTEPGGKGYPVAVAFDYGELSLAPHSRAVVYLNSNNGENWDMYAANIAEYFKQAVPETVLAVEDGYGRPGSTGIASVSLANVRQVAGVQFTLADTPNLLTVSGVNTTARTSGFAVAYNEDSSGAPTVILYSTSGDAIQHGEGSIAEITYDVSPDAVIGESAQLQFSNVVLSDQAGALVPSKSVDGIFHFAAVKGDVNGDGVIDILDVVMAVNIILGILPEPTEPERYAADFNSDGNVNVLDVVGIVNLILANPEEKSGLIVKSQGANAIGLEKVTLASGQHVDIPVQVKLSEEVAGMQLRFSYDPQILTLGEPVLTGRSSGMVLSSRDENGELVVLLYSLDGKVVQPGEGPILHIPAEVKGDVQAANSLSLVGATLSSPDVRRIPVSIMASANAAGGSLVPTEFELYQNYPNPFNSETVIKYGLPRPAEVSIKVYNSFGQVIRELVTGQMEAGYYTVTWDGTDSQGVSVSPGVYICQYDANGNLVSRGKMVVLK